MTLARMTLASLLLFVGVLLVAGCVGERPKLIESAPTYSSQTLPSTFVTPVFTAEITEVSSPVIVTKIPNSTPVTSPSPTLKQYVDGEVIVRYNASISKEQFLQISTALNAEMRGSPTDASVRNMPYIQLVHLPSDVSVESAVMFYEKNKSVDWAQPDYIYYMAATSV